MGCGTRDSGSDKVKALTAFNKTINAHPEAANEISGKLGDIRKKIIIDCMNSVRTTGYPSSSHSRRLARPVVAVMCINRLSFRWS